MAADVEFVSAVRAKIMVTMSVLSALSFTLVFRQTVVRAEPGTSAGKRCAALNALHHAGIVIG